MNLKGFKFFYFFIYGIYFGDVVGFLGWMRENIELDKII